jgi:hypothetical protein
LPEIATVSAVHPALEGQPGVMRKKAVCSIWVKQNAKMARAPQATQMAFALCLTQLSLLASVKRPASAPEIAPTMIAAWSDCFSSANYFFLNEDIFLLCDSMAMLLEFHKIE